MKTIAIKLGSLLMLLFLVVSCVSENEPEQVQKELEKELKECKESISTLKQGAKRNNVSGKAFDSNNGSYKKNGFFSVKVNVPFTNGRDSRGNSIYLEPSIVKHIDISTSNRKIILQLFQHGEDNTDVLRTSNIPLKQIYDRGYVQHIISGFEPDPSGGGRDTVYVIALHDEAYYDSSRTTSEKQEIIECLQKAVENNLVITRECLGIINKEGVHQPRTVGGGVIPPGN